MRKAIVFVALNLFVFTLLAQIQMGAERINEYLPQIKNKKVALVVNQTSIVGGQHLADFLLAKNVEVVRLMSPEHGIRGKASAGEKDESGKDSKTGLPVVSLYGSHKKPTPEDLAGVDIVLFDIQDVGVRFYTYISTMSYVMEACAENNVKMIVLDRPNPNGHYVDGPILEEKYKSFVGMHPIPIVHGMTIGEYAQMVNGEFWLKDSVKVDLTVVPCKGYDHETFYELPINPSPNLRTMGSIYLYPSLCFFEGTVVSVGRGTDFPFEVYGHPDLLGPFQFTPVSQEGASKPKHEGKLCKGVDLRNYSTIDGTLSVEWLVNAYAMIKNKEGFFNNFFEKLAGTDQIREDVIAGKSALEIKSAWMDDINAFKEIRKQYLLYKDFE